MDENGQKQNALALAVSQTMVERRECREETMLVETPGGRIHVRWDDRCKATAMGQLVFFAQYLEFTGLFDRWVAGCPLTYSSGNAPVVRDVLGTWMLSILDGHRRYSHVASLRGDAVACQILGMEKIVGDESLRRGLALIAPAPKAKHSEQQQSRQQAQVARAEEWMNDALLDSVQYALDTPWILDIDTTIKVLYGHQSGAEVSYNPTKPGRPSHVVHTYWMSNMRLVLQAHVQSGKSHSSAHTLPGLIDLLSTLRPEQRPKLVRGDCAFGNEKMMCELEECEQSYLFKLKQSANVKRLVQRQWRQSCWRDVGQGWEACEDTLKLIGWTKERRVIVMRHAVKGELLVETSPSGSKRTTKKAKNKKNTQPQQGCLQLIDTNAPTKVWEYAVLVTNSDFDLDNMGQLYRDRADCENGFDELKNQWGWGGYSTQDIERCNLSARAVAIVYNWWSWYVRLAHPKARMEAITSRPQLLAAVGTITQHAGQTRILLTVTHAAADHIKALVANVRAGLQHIRTTAPQFTVRERWQALVRYIVNKIIFAKIQNPLSATAPPIYASQ